ncbi:MAG: antitoxin VapB family protein [Candidatus Heimdallarchaeota archaeon]|nr:antitoxin VapB family protein [Candidatus Heimdallarchaeota archaeon]
MATKTLSISEEAYNNLVLLKKEGESFSQLILRLTTKKGDPKTILDTLNVLISNDDGDLEDLSKNLEEVYQIRKSRKTRKVEL